MYVCMYVCMLRMYACSGGEQACVCMYACMYACVYVCMPAVAESTSVYECTYVCTYVCMHVCMHACSGGESLPSAARVRMYVCMYVCMPAAAERVYQARHAVMAGCRLQLRYSWPLAVAAAMTPPSSAACLCTYACMHICIYACMHAFAGTPPLCTRIRTRTVLPEQTALLSLLAVLELAHTPIEGLEES